MSADKNRKYTNSYTFWQISHFGWKLIKNIKKSYVFRNGLNKIEIFEKTQKAIQFNIFLIFSWNWSKILRNPICFEMDWIKQKIPKGHKKLYILQIYHFGCKLIQHIKKSYVFWNGLNKIENSENIQTSIHVARFLISAENWSKTLRNHMYLAMDWIKQKLPKRYEQLYVLADFSFSLEIDQKH